MTDNDKANSASDPQTPTTTAPDANDKQKAKPAVPPAIEAPAKVIAQVFADTPGAPWKKPAPAQQAAAQPVKEALAEALETVESPADAEDVLDKLEAAAGSTPAAAIAAGAPPAKSVDEAASEVKRAAEHAPAQQKAADVLAETARAVETTHGPAREALAQATQETLNPEGECVETPALHGYARRRALLRQALLHRLKPANALDANLFLQINHLPHSRVSNGFFHFLTFVFNGGGGWYALLGAAAIVNRKWSWTTVRTAVVPLALSTAIVEFPVKAFFRRRRPFIDILRAIVVGKKPGTWSFPSGHSASAFAGAYVLRQNFPALTPMFYAIAGLVAFSRIYLGDHYPGDVLTGSVVGHVLAQGLHKLLCGDRK